MITNDNFMTSVKNLCTKLNSADHDLNTENHFTYEDELIYVEVSYNAVCTSDDHFMYEICGNLIDIEGGYVETDFEEDRDFTEEELEELTLSIETTLCSL